VIKLTAECIRETLSLQNLVYSRVLSKSLKIKIHNVILHHHRRRRRLSTIRPRGLFRFHNLIFLKLMNLFGQLVGLLGRGIAPTQGLYLHRTTQHRKTRTHIHASSGIRTHHPSFRALGASDCLVSVIILPYILNVCETVR
jgi:hypothetical protein